MRNTFISFLLLFAALSVAQTTFMVPMRDSVCLATDIYLPPDTADNPVPILLNRTPYGRGDVDEEFKDTLLNRGVGFAIQDSRGRGDSEGVDSLFIGNGWGVHKDGYDAVEWLAAQPWCNGDIAMIGGSGEGIMAYLATGAAPPHLQCVLAANCTGDMYHVGAFPGGCYRKEMIDNYFTIFGPSYMIDAFAEHYIYDSSWHEADLSRRYDSVTVPVFHVAGWFDPFCEGNIGAFEGFEYDGAPGAAGEQYLVIGPWCHGAWTRTNQGDLNFPANSMWDFVTPAAQFMLHHLKGEYPEVADWPAVHCYIMGDVMDTTQPGCEWVDFENWPPPEMVFDSLYLRPDQTIAPTPSTISDTGLSYDSNPDAPFIHTGGRNLFVRPGPKNQWLQDIGAQGVIWTTEPLDTPITIAGPVTARIYASSSCIDTDFMVRLCDVYPSGTSYLVNDGAIKARFREGVDHETFLEPDSIYEFEIDVGNVAISFGTGHRIRLGISSALSTRYEANPQTGEPFRVHTHTEIATNTIFCDTEHRSRIILPVLPTYPIAINEAKSRLPGAYALSAHPNPFNSAVSITAPEGAEIEIFDLNGRRVAQLPDGGTVGEALVASRDATNRDFSDTGKREGTSPSPTIHEFTWTPAVSIASGVYLVRAKTDGGAAAVKRVVYLK